MYIDLQLHEFTFFCWWWNTYYLILPKSKMRSFSSDSVVSFSTTFNTTKTTKHELALEDYSKYISWFQWNGWHFADGIFKCLPERKCMYFDYNFHSPLYSGLFPWQCVSIGVRKSLWKWLSVTQISYALPFDSIVIRNINGALENQTIYW